ncbi:MAG: hypothetical protein ACRC8W_09710 [Plesiomonas shigelloides]
MSDYLDMGDVFSLPVCADADLMYDCEIDSIADFSGYKKHCRYAAHAINNHGILVSISMDVDALKSEVMRLSNENSELLNAIDDSVSSGDLNAVTLMRKKYITD